MDPLKIQWSVYNVVVKEFLTEEEVVVLELVWHKTPFLLPPLPANTND